MFTSIAQNTATSDSLLSSLSDAALVQMERILEDESFLGSPRLSELFRFVVVMSLEGKGQYLKEYTIAVDVFKRPESFDCRLDSIVRVEAARLRKKLDQFARTNGRDDLLTLRLPSSGYEPVISFKMHHPHLKQGAPTIGIFEGKKARLDTWSRYFDSNVANFLLVTKSSLGRAEAQYDLILVVTGRDETFQDYLWLLGLLSKRSKGIFLVSDSESAESVQVLKKAFWALTRDLSSHLPTVSACFSSIDIAAGGVNSAA